jgi:hypothetical protein
MELHRDPDGTTKAVFDIVHSGNPNTLSPRELVNLLSQLAGSGALSSLMQGSVSEVCETGCDNRIICSSAFETKEDFASYLPYVPINDARGVCGGAAWCDNTPNSANRKCPQYALDTSSTFSPLDSVSTRTPVPPTLAPLSSIETRAPVSSAPISTDSIKASVVLKTAYPQVPADVPAMAVAIALELQKALSGDRTQFPASQMVLAPTNEGAATLVTFVIVAGDAVTDPHPLLLYNELKLQLADPTSALRATRRRGKLMSQADLSSLRLLCEIGCDGTEVCRDSYAQSPDPDAAFQSAVDAVKRLDRDGVCGGSNWCDGATGGIAQCQTAPLPTDAPIASTTFAPIGTPVTRQPVPPATPQPLAQSAPALRPSLPHAGATLRRERDICIVP